MRTAGVSIQRLSLHDHYIPEPTTGCWLWLRKIDRDGYGRIWNGSREIGAHKFSFESTFGSVADGLQVLHRCDTPSCVNPQHLFIGDQSVNMQDASSKGRMLYPARLPAAVRRGIAASTLARNATAQEFGVSSRTVQAIWKKVRSKQDSISN